MRTFKASSGAEVVIALAPWAAAKGLKIAIEKELLASGQPIALDTRFESAISTIMRVDSSWEVDAALWPCLIRCTRAGEKITESTFDDAEARKDYYDIVTACAEENLGPLAASLFSQFASLALKVKQAEKSPKSELPTT